MITLLKELLQIKWSEQTENESKYIKFKLPNYLLNFSIIKTWITQGQKIGSMHKLLPSVQMQQFWLYDLLVDHQPNLLLPSCGKKNDSNRVKHIWRTLHTPSIADCLHFKDCFFHTGKGQKITNIGRETIVRLSNTGSLAHFGQVILTSFLLGYPIKRAI